MQKISLIYTITFFLSLTNYPEATHAQFYPQLSSEDLIPHQLAFKQPDYEGDAPSGRDRGTGSRGNCPLAAGREEKVNLIPLIPKDSRGLTSKASPTLWVQVSYASNQRAKELFAELSVEDTQTFSKLAPKTMSVELPTSSGVFSILLSHSLEMNKWYRWYLILDCNSPDSSGRGSVISVQGMVKRVELPEFENQLATQDLQERIKVYAEQGLWYDVLDETAQLSCSEEKNGASTQSWQVLLTDDEVALDDIAQTPLICSD